MMSGSLGVHERLLKADQRFGQQQNDFGTGAAVLRLDCKLVLVGPNGTTHIVCTGWRHSTIDVHRRPDDAGFMIFSFAYIQILH